MLGSGNPQIFAFWQKQDAADFKKANNENINSVASPNFDDGATEVEVTSTHDNAVQQQLFGNYDVNAASTKELINTYRSLMNHYEVDNAVQEIVSDAIVYEANHNAVSLDLAKTEFSENIREKIYSEFSHILNTLNFQRNGSDHFKKWYIDSRIFFHKVINTEKPQDGILELRRLDPRQMQFIREIVTEMKDGIKTVAGHKSYFLYDTGSETYTYQGISYVPGTKVKIPASAIVYAHSGLTDSDGNIIGYLHRAVKPANQLKLLEDAMMIYRITRAPDRRIFYIDTGNMPAKKAAQHMQSIINSHRNRVAYDARTGKVKNQQALMSLTEDYWLQRRDGKAVTEVDTLPGMSGMNEMDDILYFRKALYLSLRVPLSRIPDEQSQNTFDIGTAISRDELQFRKFITELQHKFEPVLLEPLKTNLILKNIISEDDWIANSNNISVKFHEDSYFTEMKDIEIMERRINALNSLEPFIGKYVSHETAMKNILQMTDEEILEEQKLIKAEQQNKILNPEEDEI